MTAVVERTCTICGSADASQVYQQQLQAAFDFPGFDQRVLMCPACGFVWVSPAPSPELLDRYYTTLSNYENPQNSGEPSDEDKRKHERAYSLIRNECAGRTGRALDIGCAVPYLLDLMQRDGWDVVGTDPSPRCAEIGWDRYRIKVRTGLFAPAMFQVEEPFDVVILSHVVEHLVDPKAVLRQVAGLLADGGLLYVEVPNLLEPAVSFGFFTFEHVNYFTPTTLTGILAASGFRQRRLETYDNADGTWPFYPVIASVSEPSDSPPAVRDDSEAAARAVREYRESSAREGERIERRVAEIVSQTRPGRLAIWGAGIHTNQLLTMTGLAPGSIACVFDNDPKKHGRMLLGRPIRGLPAEAPDIASDIDAIVISSRASEIAIFEQIRHLEDFGIRIYRLYEAVPSI